MKSTICVDIYTFRVILSLKGCVSMPNFSRTLASLRKAKGLTQQELSKILGLSSSSISMYERGEREPSFETMEALADFFNVDMNYLMSGLPSAAIP